MKRNVDLTLNRDFQSDFIIKPGRSFRGMFPHLPETYQWVEDGIKKERINHNNPSTREDFDNYTNGIGIIATGSRDVRSHKLNVRGINMGKICYECGEPIRIPWKGCPCFKKYLESTGGRKESCRKQLNYPTIIK